MKQDDLTLVKHVGLSRMKLLNSYGITTIEQLYEIPKEKLAQIKPIGVHYAYLIKEAVAEYYEVKSGKMSSKVLSPKQEPVEINRNLHKRIKGLNKHLDRINEDLKPLWKKKYLSLYIELKKRSSKLKTRIDEVDQIQEDLSQKVKKNIIKKANALNSTLKKVGKKPKKKKYKEITREIKSFSKMLQELTP